MELEIKPYIGVGDLLFGMDRLQVDNIIKETMGCIDVEFDISLATMFDEFNHLELISLHRRYHRDSPRSICQAFDLEPILNGNFLIGEPLSNILKWLTIAEKSIYIDIEDEMFSTLTYGVSLRSNSSFRNKNQPIWGVEVFKEKFEEKYEINPYESVGFFSKVSHWNMCNLGLEFQSIIGSPVPIVFLVKICFSSVVLKKEFI